MDAMKDVNAKLQKQDVTIATQGATIVKQGATIAKQGATIAELQVKCGTQDEVIEGLEAKNEAQDGTIKNLQTDLIAEREARKEDIQSLVQVCPRFTDPMPSLIHS
jgi:uncharacterized coiled-coil protein SlyX